jgi:hypothetical protein
MQPQIPSAGLANVMPPGLLRSLWSRFKRWSPRAAPSQENELAGLPVSFQEGVGLESAPLDTGDSRLRPPNVGQQGQRSTLSRYAPQTP